MRCIEILIDLEIIVELLVININMRCIEIATFLPLLLLLLKCIEDDFDYTIKKYRTAVSKKMPRPEIIWDKQPPIERLVVIT